MDVVLKVIEGAKEGTKIAVKKEEFLIGRSPKCHLCAGSTAISRKHCAIIRHKSKVGLKDLGSRNGTLLNGNKIRGEVELSSGDEISVGPLRFLITITHGINNRKHPQVKNVADAVQRTAEKKDSGFVDDDISKWLLETGSSSESVSETQTIQMDDTGAVEIEKRAKELAEDETSAESASGDETHPADSETSSEDELSEEESDEKKQPGKLPKLSSKPATKDSREAAVDALRSWNRRR